MADLMADHEDIQDMMGRNFGVECDENDLLDELAELDEEIIGEQLNEGLGLPSYIPGNQNNAQPNANVAEKTEADDLQDMMKI